MRILTGKGKARQAPSRECLRLTMGGRFSFIATALRRRGYRRGARRRHHPQASLRFLPSPERLAVAGRVAPIGIPRRAAHDPEAKSVIHSRRQAHGLHRVSTGVCGRSWRGPGGVDSAPDRPVSSRKAGIDRSGVAANPFRRGTGRFHGRMNPFRHGTDPFRHSIDFIGCSVWRVISCSAG